MAKNVMCIDHGSSDHAGLLVTLHPIDKPCRPFRLLNSTMRKDGFTDLVAQCWDTHVSGTAMFKFNSDLQMLKAPIKSWLMSQNSIKKQTLTFNLQSWKSKQNWVIYKTWRKEDSW